MVEDVRNKYYLDHPENNSIEEFAERLRWLDGHEAN